MENNGSQTVDAGQGTSDGTATGDGGLPVGAVGAEGGNAGEGSTDPNAQPEGATNPDGSKPHEESVPYARFKEVNDKLSEFNRLVESAKTDPTARQQLAEMFGVQAQQPSQNTQPSVTPFQKFLAESVAPEHHAHYDGMARAISAELESYITEQMAPIMAWIGKSRLGEVEKANPDFAKYQAQVSELMKKHSSLDPEEALALATYKDRIKAASRSGQQKEQNRQQGVSKTPVTKMPGAGGSTPAKAPSSIRSMIQNAWDKNAQPA